MEKLATINVIGKWLFCPNCNRRLILRRDGKTYKIMRCNKCKKQFILKIIEMPS